MYPCLLLLTVNTLSLKSYIHIYCILFLHSRLNGSYNARSQYVEHDVPVVFHTKVIAPFYCENGCGGAKLNPNLVYGYENGECVGLNECKCNNKANKNEAG